MFLETGHYVAHADKYGTGSLEHVKFLCFLQNPSSTFQRARCDLWCVPGTDWHPQRQWIASNEFGSNIKVDNGDEWYHSIRGFSRNAKHAVPLAMFPATQINTCVNAVNVVG